MKIVAASLGIVLTLISGIVLAPPPSSAEEFSFSGKPAFTVTYPGSSELLKLNKPGQVWAIDSPGTVFIQASVVPIPEGIALKDVAEQAYKPALEKDQKVTAKMSENKEITLSEDAKAYYSELDWYQPSNDTQFSTVLVSVYKDGKWVFIAGNFWEGNYTDEPKTVTINIVKSLKFK